MVRAAIVGLGRWGQALVSAVQGKDAGITFTLGQTRSRAKAEEYCHAKGIRLVGDFDAVLADKDVDAVVLATPHSQHEDQIVRAARAGKHVFVEKPFALTRQSAVAALDAVSKAGVVLGIGYNRRFHPNMRELKARATDGRLGAIGSCVCEYSVTAGLFTARENWRSNPHETPAAAMTAIGVHPMDAMIDVLGRVSEAHCITARRAAPHADDTTSVLLKFASGATGLLFASLASAANFRFTVYGSKGFAELSPATLDTFRFVAAPDQPSVNWNVAPEAEVKPAPGFDTLNAELTAFAAAVRDRKPFPISHADILHGVEVFEAIVRSAASGQIVKLG
jgi:predicted dehydrogenase